MEEEVIRIQEGSEMASEPKKETEPMGTVISMESIKPPAEYYVPQQTQEAAEVQEAAEAPRHQQASGEEPKHTGQIETGHIEEEVRGPVFYEPPIAGRTEEYTPDSKEERPGHSREKKRMNDFFHLRKDIEDFTREDWILSRIPEENLMEYLTMEQQKSEMLRKAKETKEKRIFTTLQIAISMSAIVAVVALLKDNPTVLVNILYITGIVIALWIWRGKQDK